MTQVLSTCCLVSCVQGSAGEPLAPAVPTAGDLHVEGNPAVWNTFDALLPGLFGGIGHERSPLVILLLGQLPRVLAPLTSRTRRPCWRMRVLLPFVSVEGATGGSVAWAITAKNFLWSWASVIVAAPLRT